MKYLYFSKEFHCDGLSENNLENYEEMNVSRCMILMIQSVFL